MDWKERRYIKKLKVESFLNFYRRRCGDHSLHRFSTSLWLHRILFTHVHFLESGTAYSWYTDIIHNLAYIGEPNMKKGACSDDI